MKRTAAAAAPGMMPGLTGIEVAELVRCQTALERVVRVAMTGYGQESDWKRSRDTGFDHHLLTLCARVFQQLEAADGSDLGDPAE